MSVSHTTALEERGGLSVDLVDGRLTDDSMDNDPASAPPPDADTEAARATKAQRTARPLAERIGTMSVGAMVRLAEKMATDAATYERAASDLTARAKGNRDGVALIKGAIAGKIAAEKIAAEKAAARAASRLESLTKLIG